MTVAYTFVDLDALTVIRVAGDVESGQAATFSAMLDRAARDDRTVVVDLARSSFLSIRALHCLADLAESLHAHGRELVVRAPSPFVERMLRHATAVPFSVDPPPSRTVTLADDAAPRTDVTEEVLDIELRTVTTAIDAMYELRPDGSFTPDEFDQYQRLVEWDTELRRLREGQLPGIDRPTTE